MNLDRIAAYVIGIPAAYFLGFCVLADAAAWNRRRANLARANRARRADRIELARMRSEFDAIVARLGAPLPTIDFEEWDG